MTGKIIKGIAGFYYVNNGENKVYQCKAKGVFRNRKIKPLVGDDVEFSVLDEETMEGNIDEILPRKNELIRPAAANVDQALVLFALTHPAPNLNLLDRFLVMMSMEDIPVKLCFNKQDLGDEALMDQYRSIYEAAGYPVYFISAREETGIEQVRSLLRGKTTVLAGPSAWENLLLPTGSSRKRIWKQEISAARSSVENIPPAIHSCFLWKKILI